MRGLCWTLAVLLAGCRAGGERSAAPPSPDAGRPLAHSVPASAPPAAITPVAGAVAPAPTPAPSADFAAEARALFRVAACQGDQPTPAGFDADVVAAHCALLRPEYAGYRQGWLARATPFLSRVVPADVPGEIVYPFGGGDLITALATFPSASHFTGISLEAAGDIRRARGVTPRELERNLKQFRESIARLMRVSWSDTGKLEKVAEGALPGEVVFSLAALAAHGYQPVALRYFGIQPDGSLHYYDAAELTEPEPAPAPASPHLHTRPEHMNQRTLIESRFSHLELTFRAPGGPLKTYRHIAANLDDQHLAPGAPLLAHLIAKGKVGVMTKAASYLLWLSNFSTFRSYLLGHMSWMISDSTGIAPEEAAAAGFEEVPYGHFHGAYEHFATAWRVTQTEAELVRLWRQPAGPLDFRYGYWDSSYKSHLMITRPRAPGAAPGNLP